MTAAVTHRPTLGNNGDPLARLAKDVNLLTQPRHQTRYVHPHHWDQNRNLKLCDCPPIHLRWPPLLDQLRAAVRPGAGLRQGPQKRRKLDSRLPVNIEALATLTRIETGLHEWHRWLRLPRPPSHRFGCLHPSCHRVQLLRDPGPVCPLAAATPPAPVDWHKTVLRQLVGAAPTIAPSLADDLADDVHDWVRWTAAHAGWYTEELI